MKKHILLCYLFVLGCSSLWAQHLHNSTNIIVTSGTSMYVGMELAQGKKNTSIGYFRNDGDLHIKNSLVQEDTATFKNNAQMLVKGSIDQKLNAILENSSFLTVEGDFKQNTASSLKNTRFIIVNGYFKQQDHSTLRNTETLSIGSYFEQDDKPALENYGTLSVGGYFKQSDNSFLTTNKKLSVGQYFESSFSTVQNTAQLDVVGNLTLAEGKTKNFGNWGVKGDFLHKEEDDFVNKGSLSVRNMTQTGQATLNHVGFMTINGNLKQDRYATIFSTGAIFISGSWTNDSKNTAFVAIAPSKVQFAGNTPSSISGSYETTFRYLEVNNPSITVLSRVDISKKLDFVSGTINFKVMGKLLNGARIANEREEHYALGKLAYSTAVYNRAEDFAGLGIAVNTTEDLGSVTLIRKTGKVAKGISTLGGYTNMMRSWHFQVGNQPTQPVTVSINWLKGDEKGLVNAEMQIWEDKGSGWLSFLPSTYYPDRQTSFSANKLYSYTVGGVALIKVSGVVNELNYGVSGVNVELKYKKADGKTTTLNAITDNNGAYAMYMPSGSSGTLTLSKQNEFHSAYTFVSADTVVSATMRFKSVYTPPTYNFDAYTNYKVKGKVFEYDSQAVKDVQISIYDKNQKMAFQTVTDEKGKYTAFVTSGFEGKLIAQKGDWVFDPVFYAIQNRLKTIKDKDFKATAKRFVQGKVLEAGLPLSDATVTLSNGFTTITDKNGFYTAFMSSGFSGTLKLSKEKYVFQPDTLRFKTALKSYKDQDFVASTLYRIQGVVAQGDTLRAGVKIIASNHKGKVAFTTVSGVNGSYNAFVSSGFSGTVRAKKLGFIFHPALYNFTSVLKNHDKKNFKSEGLYRITGRIQRNGTGDPLAKVGLQPQGDTTVYYSDQNGFYTAFVSTGFTGKLYAKKTGFSFKPNAYSFVSVEKHIQNKNFKATGLIPIVGQVVAGDTAVNRASVMLSNMTEHFFTDKNGFYTAYVDEGYKGFVKVEKKHYLFTPDSIKIPLVTKKQLGLNFKGRLRSYAIEGQILLDKTKPLKGIRVAVGDSIAFTDQNGFYTVFQRAGYKGYIKPDSTLDYFKPDSIQLAPLFTTAKGHDFNVYSAPIALVKDQKPFKENDVDVYCSRVNLSVNLDTISSKWRNAVKYTWTGGVTTSSFPVNHSGTYEVLVKVPTYYPTKLSQKIQMSQNHLTVDWGKDTLVCTGSSATLHAPKGDNITRVWKKKENGAFIKMSNSDALSQNVSVGVYQLELKNRACNATYQITVKQAPKMTFDSLVSTQYYFCNQNDPVILKGKNKYAVKYKWTGPEGFSSKDSTIKVSLGGKYTLLLTDKQGCTEERTIEVIDNQRIENRFVFASKVRAGDTVVFVNLSRKLKNSETEPTKALWKFGKGGKSSDYKQTEFVFKKEGNHKISLHVSNANCGIERTKFLTVVPMPLGGRPERVYPNQELDYVIQKVSLYPNPVKDIFQLKTYNLPEPNSIIRIYDNYGQKIFDDRVDVSKPYQVNVSKLGTGVYFVEIISGSTVKTIRFVKM